MASTTFKRLQLGRMTVLFVRAPYIPIALISLHHGQTMIASWSVGQGTRRVLRSLRRLFPSFHSVGLRDCDSGGRVFAWYPVFAWNDWHLQRLVIRWNGAGDGEVWHQVSFREYLALRRRESRHG